jgi:hypothetical protein
MKRRHIFGISLIVLFLVSGPAVAQQWKLVAVLASDTSAEESDLIVDILEKVEDGKLIRIESRNGKVIETYEVRHVYQDHIILMEPLRTEFIAGAKIYQ